jgi:hypothetical protein
VAPEDRPLVTLLEDYGATFCEVVDDSITHVVCGQKGTEKVRQARKIPVRVVHVSWLIDSIRHFKRMDENLYTELPEHRKSSKRTDILIKEIANAYGSHKDLHQGLQEGQEEEIDEEELMRMMLEAEEEN